MGLQLSSTAHSSHNDCLFGRKDNLSHSSAENKQQPALKKHTTASISPPHKRRLVYKKGDKVILLIPQDFDNAFKVPHTSISDRVLGS